MLLYTTKQNERDPDCSPACGIETRTPVSTCWSKGAMPGTNSMARNSMVPSTLKCATASGSRNSLKVSLKKSSYSAFSTCRGVDLNLTSL